MSMKTKTISIYNIHELDERAQEKAHSDYLNNGFEYFWLDEWRDSLGKFCDLFGVSVVDWELRTDRRGDSYIKTDAEQANFRGIRAKDIIKKAPFYAYAVDEIMFQAFKQYAARHGDIKGAFQDAIDEALIWALNDMEYQESFEYFLEMAEENEWEYLEDGSSAWRCAA